ncbi:MAG: hypothetical protein ACK5MD_01325 [Flavobacteriales bacterium]
MRKVFFLIATTLFLASCSLTKENKEYRKAIDGKWIIEDVTYEGPEGTFDIDAFGEGKPECFIGSTWILNQNNSSGTYNLPGEADCNSGQRIINWSVYQPASGLSYFQYKVTSGFKAKNIVSGYRLGVDMVSSTKMILRSSNKIEGENESYDIIYHFRR